MPTMLPASPDKPSTWESVSMWSRPLATMPTAMTAKPPTMNQTISLFSSLFYFIHFSHVGNSIVAFFERAMKTSGPSTSPENRTIRTTFQGSSQSNLSFWNVSQTAPQPTQCWSLGLAPRLTIIVSPERQALASEVSRSPLQPSGKEVVGVGDGASGIVTTASHVGQLTRAPPADSPTDSFCPHPEHVKMMSLIVHDTRFPSTRFEKSSYRASSAL